MNKEIKEITLIEKGLIKNEFKLTTNNIKSNLKYNDISIELQEKETINFIDKLLRLTSTWNHINYKYNNIDSVVWILEIVLNNNKIIKYEGNEYPNNYQTLQNLIGEVIHNGLN